MMLHLIIVVFLLKSTFEQQTTIMDSSTLSETSTTKEKPLLLYLEASPAYPVSAGQTVHLQCKAAVDVVWYCQCFYNQNWGEVHRGQELFLTKPQESGVYWCQAKNGSSQLRVSNNHTVLIVAAEFTVKENLGAAAFALSLLIFLSIVVVLLMLGWQNYKSTVGNPSPSSKENGSSSKVAPEGSSSKTEADGDMYINYSNSNPAYTDLDPSNMSADDVYSILS